MRLNTRILDAISILLAAGLALLLWRQHLQVLSARADNLALQPRVADAASLAVEHDRLSQLVSQVEASAPPANEQLTELARLRLESQARHQEIVRLSAQYGSRPPRSFADGIPKSSWSFTGFSTPESTLESLVWAMHRGDMKTMFSGMVPEEAARVKKEFGGQSEEEVANKFLAGRDESEDTTLQILSSKNISGDEVRVTVYLSTDEQPSVLTLKRIDGLWKVSSSRDDGAK